MVVGALMYVAVNSYATIGGGTDLTWFFVTAGAWNLFLIAATVVAIVDSIRKVRAKKTAELAVDAMVVKFAAIPFSSSTSLC